MRLAEAVDLTRTGDVWLFRGRSVADRAIQLTTNSPVNHVGMAVTIGDLPPLLWHAELGRSLVDVWSGTRQRGVQLHLLQDAVRVWNDRYGQRAWVRQFHGEVTAEMEDALLRTVARMDGLPFPSTAALAARWARGRVPVRGTQVRVPMRGVRVPMRVDGARVATRRAARWMLTRVPLRRGEALVAEGVGAAVVNGVGVNGAGVNGAGVGVDGAGVGVDGAGASRGAVLLDAEIPAHGVGDQEMTLEAAYCAEVVALTYQAMGLLAARRPPNWYDPGRFWSGDDLRLEGGAWLGDEIAVTLR